MRDRLMYLGFIVAVVVAAVLIGKAVYDYQLFRTLNDEGRIASATVSGLQPTHGRLGRLGRWVLSYDFQTHAGKSVSGAVGVPPERAAEFHVGQRIDVVYAPSDPALSALDPEQAWAIVLYDERVLVPYMALLMVLTWNALERLRGKRT